GGIARCVVLYRCAVCWWDLWCWRGSADAGCPVVERFSQLRRDTSGQIRQWLGVRWGAGDYLRPDVGHPAWFEHSETESIPRPVCRAASHDIHHNRGPHLWNEYEPGPHPGFSSVGGKLDCVVDLFHRASAWNAIGGRVLCAIARGGPGLMRKVGPRQKRALHLSLQPFRFEELVPLLG